MDDLSLLFLLNNFIIEIIYKHKHFNEVEYNAIKNISDNSIIERKIDCPANIQMKKDVQYYTFYFLLEYIKNITSINNKKTRTQI